MTRKKQPEKPIMNPPTGLRQRQRADGSWRIWWEPRPEQRALGMTAAELSEKDIAWSRREADRLNREYGKAVRTQTRPAQRATGRTIDDLIVTYRGSVGYSDKAAKTRTGYDKMLRQISDKWGAFRVIDFDKATMLEWYETMYRTKGIRMAQAMIRMMSILFNEAEVRGWRPENTNPCWRLKMKTPDPRTRVATWAEIDALLAAAMRLGMASVDLAIRLSVFQGQRQTDVLAATRGSIALREVMLAGDAEPRPRWIWTFRRSKRGNWGSMELHEETVAAVRAAMSDAGTAEKPRLPTDAMLIEERVGRAYDADLFRKRWGEVRAEAAKDVPSCATVQFRDLRRTFGVLARMGGASRDDTADVLGNTANIDPALAETYMPSTFETASRAVAAVRRPANPERKKA